MMRHPKKYKPSYLKYEREITRLYCGDIFYQTVTGRMIPKGKNR